MQLCWLDLVKRALRFLGMHVVINMINYVVAYMYFRTCYGWMYTNVLFSFVHTYLYSSSEYCVAVGMIMEYTAYISRGMWHTIGATVCLEAIGWINLNVKKNDGWLVKQKPVCIPQ